MPRIIRSALMSSLDQYMAKPEPVPPPRPRPDPKAQLKFRPSLPQELAESYFVGAGYDGERRAVYLKLYEPKSQKIHFWYDNTGHTPYCLSKELPEKLEKNQSLVRHPGFVKFERSKRFDALKGEDIPVTVIYARDPLSIGGRPLAASVTSSKHGKQTFDTPRTTSTIVDSSPECLTPSNSATSSRFNQEVD